MVCTFFCRILEDVGLHFVTKSATCLNLYVMYRTFLCKVNSARKFNHIFKTSKLGEWQISVIRFTTVIIATEVISNNVEAQNLMESELF